MAEGISIPTGAFDAAKAGIPWSQPTAEGAPSELQKANASIDVKIKEPPKEVQEEREHIPTQKEPKIWKLKADGEEFEFDASDDEKVKREIMKSRGADKRFKEAAAQRQQAEQFINMLKDPGQLEQVFSKLGVDFDKIAEDRLWNKIQESQLTPEQKEQREKERDYQRLKDMEQNWGKIQKDLKFQQDVAHNETQYERTILKALETQGIPKDHYTVAKMADYMVSAVKQGYDVTFDEIASQIKKDNAEYFRTHTEHMSDEQLIELLGQRGAEKFRKADVKRVRSPTANPFPERMPRSGERKEAPIEKLHSADWRDAITKEFLGRNR